MSKIEHIVFFKIVYARFTNKFASKGTTIGKRGLDVNGREKRQGI
jgi:hypothetical protein